MLKLKGKISLSKSVIDSSNLTNRFSREDLNSIGNWVLEGFKLDLESRRAWERRTEASMDLALQVQKEKNFPWPNCSNIAFPLVTIAALQLHARAYPALIPGPDVVKMRVPGSDPSGDLGKAARRVSTHMSWQVLEEDQPWEEGQDRLLIHLPIVGTAFKKSFHCPRSGHNKSELVLAKDLVLNYWAKSVEDCPRKTHILPVFRNEIYEKCITGVYRDVLGEKWFQQAPTIQVRPENQGSDDRRGVNPPQQGDETTPFDFLEQHCSLDLDQDGYAEPYIITVERESGFVMRIVTRFDRLEDIERTPGDRLVRVNAREYFTKYGFIPSPDGGIYDLGFGVLLGPINEGVNTGINQLFDAGTWATTAGGFLGRGAKIRGGVYTAAPLEWKRVDSSGDDLRKSIVPHTVREPSAVLFQLLVLLINYANRIPGTTEMMVGENPGQNTPAYNAQEMIRQGSKIYNDIFKRVWRCMKEEFRKLYILNGVWLPSKVIFRDGATAYREDYLLDSSQVVPAADPNMASEAERTQQAVMLKQAAASTPGYDVEEVERQFLRSIRVENLDSVYPGLEKKPPPPNIKLQLENMRLQGKVMVAKQQQMQFAAKLMEDQRVNQANIVKIEAEVVKILADVKGDAQDRQINALNTALGALKAHDESLRKRIELLLQGLELDQQGQQMQQEQQGPPTGEGGGNVREVAGIGANGGGLPGLAAAPGNGGGAPILPGPQAEPSGAMVGGGVH